MYGVNLLLVVLGVLVAGIMVYGAIARSKLIFVTGAALLLAGLLIFFALRQAANVTAIL